MSPQFHHANTASTLDPGEVAKFEAIAAEWWDESGPMKPLHALNPLRVAYIRDGIATHFGRDPQRPKPLRELKVLDVGSGGGLLAEPLARLGASVTGIDAAEGNVLAAGAHAASQGLEIDYRCQTVEDLAATGGPYDVVTAMEIVEHVGDLRLFLASCAALVAPGGLLFAATLNRTAKSFATAIVGAEYVLRWLPRGTHDWRKFVRPSEMAAGLRPSGLRVEDLTGVRFDPLSRTWQTCPDLSVNYMLRAARPA